MHTHINTCTHARIHRDMHSYINAYTNRIWNSAAGRSVGDEEGSGRGRGGVKEGASTIGMELLEDFSTRKREAPKAPTKDLPTTRVTYRTHLEGAGAVGARASALSPGLAPFSNMANFCGCQAKPEGRPDSLRNCPFY